MSRKSARSSRSAPRSAVPGVIRTATENFLRGSFQLTEIEETLRTVTSCNPSHQRRCSPTRDHTIPFARMFQNVPSPGRGDGPTGDTGWCLGTSVPVALGGGGAGIEWMGQGMPFGPPDTPVKNDLAHDAHGTAVRTPAVVCLQLFPGVPNVLVETNQLWTKLDGARCLMHPMGPRCCGRRGVAKVPDKCAKDGCAPRRDPQVQGDCGPQRRDWLLCLKSLPRFVC